MATLADKIEKYLKTLIEKSEDGIIEIQRTEIAETFSCVPSQINYVLTTRFSKGSGYHVETKRGGGGYIKITKTPAVDEEKLLQLIDQSVNNLVSQKVGNNLIKRLESEGFLTHRESLLMKAVIKQETLALSRQECDLLRARILRGMLLTLLRDDFQD